MSAYENCLSNIGDLAATSTTSKEFQFGVASQVPGAVA
jgi:hypothetical protein